MLVSAVACGAPVEPDDRRLEGEPPDGEAQCEPDALRCDGALLRLCSAQGDEEPVLEVCRAPELCDPELGCREVVLTRRGEPLTIPYAIR